jgi:hypothetical protein
MADYKLMDLVRKFDDGQIQLPLMQRDYVWRPAKVIDLLDSLYKKWPIGVFYIWQTTYFVDVRPPSIHLEPGKKVTGEFLGYLLDGQQRLTSLSRALDDKNGDILASRAFYDVRKNGFVMGNKTRTIEKRIAADDPTLIELCQLVPKAPVTGVQHEQTRLALIDRLIEGKVIKDTSQDRAEYMARLTRIATMLDATPPVEFFKTGDKDEDLDAAILLFKRLNKGGTPLAKGDAEAATLTKRATAKILPKMRAFVQGDGQARLGLNFVFATRALITNYRNSSRFSDLPNDWATKDRDINEVWAETERGLSSAVAFVRDQLGWTTRRWLPSASALIPLCYLLRDRDGGFLDSEHEHVRQYLCLTGLRGVFRGAVETTIDNFVSPIRKAPSKAQRRAFLLVKRIPKDRRRRITAADILAERGMYSPLMQVFMAYLVSKGAKTWLEDATLLDVAKRDIGDPIAVHHVFPRKVLRDNEVETERINCMANYAILSQADNAQIGDEHPKTFYDAMKGSEKDNADKQLFGIIAENRDWLESYDAFLTARAERLAKELNRYLGLE